MQAGERDLVLLDRDFLLQLGRTGVDGAVAQRTEVDVEPLRLLQCA
jgi:hypothetical protein